ncbi:MAG: hypothetical protein V7K69_23550 [Nostoc sp.]
MTTNLPVATEIIPMVLQLQPAIAGKPYHQNCEKNLHRFVLSL